MRAAGSAWLFLLLCLGVFLAALDQTSVVTVLPPVMLDLGVPITRLNDAAWLVTAYLLGFTVAMPLLGRVGDVYGHDHLYRGALVVFTVGSVLVALAESLGWLVAARVLQAVGGGALVPAAIALASQQVGPERRGVVLGVLGAATEAGAVLGPLYGGAIAEAWGWRWVFWLNVPVGAVLLVALARVRAPRYPAGGLDPPGGLALTGGLLLVTLGLSQRGLFSLASATPYLLVGAGVVLLVSLGVLEARARAPLLDPALFLARRFVAAFSAQLLVGGALILALVTVPLMTDVALGKPVLEGGLRLMRMTGAIPLGAVLGGYAGRLAGYRAVTVVGLVLAALGLFGMSTWSLEVRDPMMTFHLAVAGLGFGLVIAPLLTTGVNAVPAGYAGTAAALITVARMLGMTLGLAAISAWGMEQFQALTAGLSFPLPTTGQAAAEQERLLAEYQAGLSNASLTLFHRFFLAGAVLSLAAIGPALRLGGRPALTSSQPGRGS